MSYNGDAYDGATAVGDNTTHTQMHLKGKLSSTSRSPTDAGPGPAPIKPSVPVDAAHLPFVDSSDFLHTKRPLCVAIGKGGVRTALEALNQELIASGAPALISTKKPHQVIGREVNPGSFGLYEYASQPQLILEPGKYPGLPFSNWIGCDWRGTFNLTNNFPPLENNGRQGLLEPNQKLAQLGLTIVQVSQNQAAVCL
jgi:hypothetical protein